MEISEAELPIIAESTEANSYSLEHFLEVDPSQQGLVIVRSQDDLQLFEQVLNATIIASIDKYGNSLTFTTKLHVRYVTDGPKF